jgi:hypothetical protein
MPDCLSHRRFRHLRPLPSPLLHLMAACFIIHEAMAASSIRAETYFIEDFEGANARAPQRWWGDANGKVRLTDEKAFSGKRSALIETGPGYWEIPLPKPLRWDRSNPAGVGNRPLYLSMRVYAVSGGASAGPGFHTSIVPKRHPANPGVPMWDPIGANVAGRTGQWLQLCFDVGQVMRRQEERGFINADLVVLEGISFLSFSGGKFYVDDVRLSTERPENCSPPPPQVDAVAQLRRDPKLEGMVLHGIYGGVGSVLEDVQLHPAVMRDIKRHYLNFINGPQYFITSPEPFLRAVEKTLDQAAQYNILHLPSSYIGDKYAHAFPEMQKWSEEKLRSEMLKVVRRFKNKTHLLGWYLEEESEIDRAAAALKQKRWVEEEDPQHRVWNTFCSADALLNFGPAYAVACIDFYPIFASNPNPWVIPRYVASEAPKFKQPFMLTDQIFAGSGRWATPTVGQWRLMVYGAMAEGVKGFFHFLYSTAPLYRCPDGERLYGGMTDAYGTPSPIYREIESHLGPDLFSIGELLRTCRSDSVPTGVHMDCDSVENNLEKKIPAIAVRRLVDTAGGYEILAMYSNNPDKKETGVLHIPASWLKGRIVMDLTAHSRDILRQTPFQVEGDRMPVQLDAGDGRFLAVVNKQQSNDLIHRMQSRRFEALRKMVEFDCRWLAEVKVGKPYSAEQWNDLQQICDQKSPHDALQRAMQLEKANQELIHNSPLTPVLGKMDVARDALTAAADTIAKWAVPKQGQPFPAHVEPGKSYCVVQDKLGELHVGLSDLAYSQTPEALVQPTAELAKYCTQHAEQLKNVSRNGIPKQSCQLTLKMLKSLGTQLAALGWTRPPTALELQRQPYP